MIIGCFESISARSRFTKKCDHTHGVGVDGMGGEQKTGQSGESGTQRRHGQADFGHEHAGGSVKCHVRRVIPAWRQTGSQVIQPEITQFIHMSYGNTLLLFVLLRG